MAESWTTKVSQRTDIADADTTQVRSADPPAPGLADDELHNINLTENTKTAEAVALKKKGNQAGQYTGYDDDEFTEHGKAGVLAKYDEDITGADDGGFRLGAAPAPPKPGAKGKGRAKAEDDEPEKEKVKLSMDYTKGFNNDYLQEGESGFKIKKKKKRAPVRVKEAEEGLEGGDADGMEVDGAAEGGRIERQNLDETNLIDDDDLQASLARTRREQNRKKVQQLKANAAKAGPSSIGNGMDVDGVKREDSPDELYSSGGRTGGDDDDILVMDDTSEFVRNIQLAVARPAAAPTNGVKRNLSPLPQPPQTSSSSARPAGLDSVQPRIKAEEVDVPISEMTGGFGSPHEEGEYDEDAQMDDGYGDAPGVPEEDVKPKLDDEDEFGTTAGEKLVSRGMAATLGLLRNQGLLKERTAEEMIRDRTQKEREAWLAEQRAREREREQERLASRAAGSAISQEQRTYENRMREQRDAQIALEAFKDYKPNVNITYHDEFGRDQTLKEAYKQLSHTFHGKGSGTKKTEKRLKKIEEERKQAAMVSGDTPLSSASAFAARAERMGSATMVLSVGNRGTAPVQDEILNNLKKPDAKGKGKLKPTAATALPGRAAVIEDIPLRPLPLPEAGEVGRGASPATVRAGFAPVRSFTPIGEGGDDGGATGEEAGRKGFSSGGFVPIAVKRKADGEPVVEGQTGRVKR